MIYYSMCITKWASCWLDESSRGSRQLDFLSSRHFATRRSSFFRYESLVGISWAFILWGSFSPWARWLLVSHGSQVRVARVRRESLGGANCSITEDPGVELFGRPCKYMIRGVAAHPFNARLVFPGLVFLWVWSSCPVWAATSFQSDSLWDVYILCLWL